MPTPQQLAQLGELAQQLVAFETVFTELDDEIRDTYGVVATGLAADFTDEVDELVGHLRDIQLVIALVGDIQTSGGVRGGNKKKHKNRDCTFQVNVPVQLGVNLECPP